MTSAPMPTGSVTPPTPSPRILDLATHREPHITVEQLAEFWGVSPRTLYRHIEKGALRVVYIGPFRRIRIPIQEARRYGRPVW